jgi:hypothetical protein
MRKPATDKLAWSVALLALLALAALAGYMHWGKQSRANPSARDADEKPVAVSKSQTPSADIEVTNQSDNALADPSSQEPIFVDPLPASDTVVADVFDELYDRAQRGDARAACWLGRSLKRCAKANAQMKSANELIDISAKMNEPNDSLVKNIARIEQFGRSLDAGCSGLGDEQFDMAFALEMQAARAIPKLRLHTVLDPGLDPRMFIRDLDRWTEYKRVALPWLEEAAANGEPAALITLARIFGDHRRVVRLYPPFRIRDDAKFVLYSDLMARYGIHFDAAQHDLDAARARLTTDAQAEVLEQIDALYRPEREKLSAEQVQDKLRESLDVRADPSQCDVPAG